MNIDREKFKARREKAGFTISQLADFLGVHRATVWRWEVGDCPIPTTAWMIVSKLRARGK